MVFSKEVGIGPGRPCQAGFGPSSYRVGGSGQGHYRAKGLARSGVWALDTWVPVLAHHLLGLSFPILTRVGFQYLLLKHCDGIKEE